MRKRHNLTKVIITIILLTNLIITTTQADTEKQTKTQTPPDITPEKLRVNLTNTIPNEFTHQTPAETPQQLQFQNMILELTTTRNTTMTITSDDQVRFQYLQMTMETTQNLHLNMHMAQTPPENIPEPEKGIQKYLTIEPKNTDPIRTTLRLYLNQEELPEGTTPEQYTWCYWNGTHWDPTPTRYTMDGLLETNTTHLSTWSIKEQQKEAPREMQPPETPGVREETKAYNYTDVTPSGFQYKIQKNTPIMLQFRNSAIYMHSTNPVDLEYSAEEQNRNRLIRVDVEAPDPLRLRFNLRESKPEEVDTPEKGIGFYCEVEPNQTITHARLGYEVNSAELKSRGLEAESLSWAYWNGTHWDLVESTLNVDNVLETETSHFSTWTILEYTEPAMEEPTVEPVTDPVEEPESEDASNMIPIPAYALAVGLLVTIFVIKRKHI